MNDLWRVLATFAIWMGLPFVVAATGSSIEKINVVLFLSILAVCAAVSTRSIWHSAGAGTERRDEKAKRTKSRRVQRFVETLSPDEMEALRARLAISDDEPMPLEVLVAPGERDRI